MSYSNMAGKALVNGAVGLWAASAALYSETLTLVDEKPDVVFSQKLLESTQKWVTDTTKPWNLRATEMVHAAEALMGADFRTLRQQAKVDKARDELNDALDAYIDRLVRCRVNAAKAQRETEMTQAMVADMERDGLL